VAWRLAGDASLWHVWSAHGVRLMPVSLDDFTDAVRRLAELKEQGLARLAIGPDGGVAVGIDPSAEDAPAPGGGLFVDIFDALTAIANDTPVEEFVSLRSKPRPGFDEPESEETSRAKYNAAAAFAPDELRRRTWLRATSKLPVLVAIDWEVLVKEFDSGSPAGEPARRIPVGQLRFAVQRTPRTFLPDIQEMLLGLDLEDVDDILRELEQLRAALIRVAEEGASIDSGTSSVPPSD
jgi:hypothetical protein